ncbi:ABC transporter substrate-binding protein [Litchfieldella qijiaojingensis]|uniref:ABC transporter substrate-binding protein n=1 Tax=Litchfieldella qijiaojingensis TaxID=980347 RepID=A0ABQ2YY92_9GAMM|nr:TRAP transporter substrate-binding protein DctP [Halomonas qijiaojingensis]GGX99312.1 ABC transporter substrate-binding protein [Halomonas qijiaojingensis]
MKPIIKFALSGLAAGIALAAFSTPALSQEKARWTMTTTWPDNLSLIEIDRHWVETVNKIAGDELEIDFRAGGTLMPATEVFDATETGSIEASGDWPGYWAGRSSAFSPLAATPSLFNGVDYLNWILEWGGFELYQEVYGDFNMVYLPYGITNNESGFMGRTKIESLADLEGKRLRLSGRDQGRVLERLGGSQVTLSGGEIYQAVERGVVDGAEFSTPGVDYQAGFAEVVDYWATPGWHQSASVFGVMINKDAWDELSEATQEKLKVAAEATLAWSLAWSERTSTEGTEAFKEAGVEISTYSEEDMARIQEMTNEVIVEGACEDPMHAKVYHSMVSYMQNYANWRDVSVPYNMSRRIDNLPSLEEIEACM